ncbi:hypothetical protein M3Y99_00697900 [Aphelenchoides fujianensis]|nr:hypothetical protein M3Y99_00697900 [Aphelenchoides fujianensis]
MDESDDSEAAETHEWMKREWSEYEDLHKTDDVDICCDIELLKRLENACHIALSALAAHPSVGRLMPLL